MKTSFVISVLFLIVAEASLAAGVVDCKALLAEPQTGLVKQTDSSHSREIVDPAQSRNLLVQALKKHYREWHSSEAIIKLMRLGVDRTEISELVKPILEQDLAELENVGDRLRLTKPDYTKQIVGAPTRQKVSRKAMSLEEFSQTYQLESARVTAAEIMGFGAFLRGTREVSISDVLRSALLVGDPALISRAKTEAFRYNQQSDIIGVAAESKDQALLMNLAEINVARYLYGERNPNWLSYALKAFVEISGPQKLRAQAMLYDLADIMNSSEIVANGHKVAMMGEAKSDAYAESALKVLMTTLDLSRRENRDSVSFDYIMRPSAEIEYTSRIKNIALKVLHSNQGVETATLVSAIALTNDKKFQLDMAQKFYESRKNVPENLDERKQAYYINSRVRTAFGLVMVSSNEAALRTFLTSIAQERDVNFEIRPFFVSEPATYYFSAALVKKIKILGPEILKAKNAEQGEVLKELAEFLTHFDYIMGKQTNPTAGSKILFESTFNSEVTAAKDLIEASAKLSPIEIQKIRAQAEEKLSQGSLWESYRGFGKARDIVGLKKVYDAMMINGRGVDAVYVVTAIVTLQSQTAGSSLFLESNSELRSLK